MVFCCSETRFFFYLILIFWSLILLSFLSLPFVASSFSCCYASNALFFFVSSRRFHCCSVHFDDAKWDSHRLQLFIESKRNRACVHEWTDERGDPMDSWRKIHITFNRFGSFGFWTWTFAPSNCVCVYASARSVWFDTLHDGQSAGTMISFTPEIKAHYNAHRRRNEWDTYEIEEQKKKKKNRFTFSWNEL